MTLGEKQELFARLFQGLLGEAHKRSLGVRIGEVYRPKEMAAIYAEKGMGIKNSNHTRKLAVDIFLTQNGELQWGVEAYRPLGIWWEDQHPLCRWGGRFKRRDAYHFSLAHGNVA